MLYSSLESICGIAVFVVTVGYLWWRIQLTMLSRRRFASEPDIVRFMEGNARRATVDVVASLVGLLFLAALRIWALMHAGSESYSGLSKVVLGWHVEDAGLASLGLIGLLWGSYGVVAVIRAWHYAEMAAVLRSMLGGDKKLSETFLDTRHKNPGERREVSPNDD